MAGGYADPKMNINRERAILRAAHKAYRERVRGNMFGLTTALITEEAVMSRWLGYTPQCALTGKTADLRLVPARPGPFDETNMRLVHKHLVAYFSFDGSDDDCFDRRFGVQDSGLGAAPPKSEAVRDTNRWTVRKPLRFVVVECLGHVDAPPVTTVRGEVEVKSAMKRTCSSL